MRPLCLCRNPRLPMYIARIGDQHVIKRMPMSGTGHYPKCPSYEMPGKLPGLDPLLGSPIQLDPSSERAELKVDFSLSKMGSRAPAKPGVSAGEKAVRDAARLSLRGLLHFLWSEAELTHWTAWWTNKRQWWHVRQYLLQPRRLF